jgi:hypothetical protein
MCKSVKICGKENVFSVVPSGFTMMRMDDIASNAKLRTSSANKDSAAVKSNRYYDL